VPLGRGEAAGEHPQPGIGVGRHPAPNGRDSGRTPAEGPAVATCPPPTGVGPMAESTWTEGAGIVRAPLSRGVRRSKEIQRGEG